MFVAAMDEEAVWAKRGGAGINEALSLADVVQPGFRQLLRQYESGGESILNEASPQGVPSRH